MIKPTVFVGSSSEGLAIAQEIALHLDDAADVTLWKDGIFTLGSSFLEALTRLSIDLILQSSL